MTPFWKNTNNFCRILREKMDKKFLKLINRDLPATPRPFSTIGGARRAGKFIIGKIKELKKKGVISTYSAKIDQYKAGYLNNAMVVWRVAKKNADKIAKIMIKYPCVSHCYLRVAKKYFPYNLYTMIHCRTKAQLDEVVNEISKKTKIKKFVVLKTLKRFKKTKQAV